MTYKTAIIGLGNIGMLYDYGSSIEKTIVTHCTAIKQNTKFEIVAGIDTEKINRLKFIKKFKAPAFKNIHDALKATNPNILIISTPTNTHLPIIKSIFKNQFKPLAILCEKPLAPNSKDAISILKKASAINVPIYINYMRRLDPGILEVKRRILSGEIESPFKGFVWYSKGLIHNGSHFIDLLTNLLGKPLKHSVIDAPCLSANPEMNPDFLVEFNAGSFYFCAVDERNYSHYTMEIIAKNGRLRYESTGKITWQSVEPSPVFSNYKFLTSQPEEICSDPMFSQKYTIKHLESALSGIEHNLCTGEEGLNHIKFLEKIMSPKSI